MNLNIIFDSAEAALIEGLRSKDRALDIMKELRRDTEEYTGWVNWPSSIPEAWMREMESAAASIRTKCDKFIVVGIGGSYLGAAAIVDALGGSAPGCPEILFAGNTLSGNYHADFGPIVRDNDVCICVVSKSGGTMESRLAFSILKDMLYEKYGRKEAAERIVAITDPVKGILREEVAREGYTSFEIPANIGGRYSAFTPTIMLPLAVAGADIRAFVRGAQAIQENEQWWNEKGVNYALARYALFETGKTIEVFEYYDPSLRLIGEWCKQLFGESEGKDGKGLFPTSLTLSTDLHSMGQFLQEGNQVFFETVINILNWDKDVIIPETAGDNLAGRSLNDINQMAVKGVIAAHSKADIPIVQIELDNCKEYSLGQLLYFLMMTAAVTGKLMDVNPFNQLGVEKYKSEIRTLLGQ
ncbi:MAG: glucose-6-phosphate isomerase [Clostridiales bacterium]|nr:glucose-6-phosphate isomerase [Candidatus Crickella caballi]